MSLSPSPLILKNDSNQAVRRLWPGTTFIVLLLLGACATKFRPLKSGTGYSSAQVRSNEFAVSFQGNADTSLERTYDFALLRSAEVTLENEFHFFSVLDVTNTSSAQRYTRVYRTFSAPVPGAQDFGRDDDIPAPYTMQVEKPETYYQPGTVFLIRCFKECPGNQFAYNAAALAQSLKRKYNIR